MQCFGSRIKNCLLAIAESAAQGDTRSVCITTTVYIGQHYNCYRERRSGHSAIAEPLSSQRLPWAYATFVHSFIRDLVFPK